MNNDDLIQGPNSMRTFIYYRKRVGWHWEVWHKYADGGIDPYNGSKEWSNFLSFWRWTTAEKVAMQLNGADASANFKAKPHD